MLTWRPYNGFYTLWGGVDGDHTLWGGGEYNNGECGGMIFAAGVTYTVRSLPGYDQSPEREDGFASEEQPEEPVVTLSYAVTQPGAVVVESFHAATAGVAVLRADGLRGTTEAAVIGTSRRVR